MKLRILDSHKMHPVKKKVFAPPLPYEKNKTYSRWRSLISIRLLPLLLLLLLPMVTWWELMRTARVLRLIWSRSPRGVSRVRRGTRPIPLKTTRVVLWTVSFVTTWVAVLWRSPSIIGWSPCFSVITWWERSARIGSWISRVTVPWIILGRAREGPKGRHITCWGVGTKKIPFMKTERKLINIT